MTKQHKLILDIINRSRSHPNADDIYKEAKLIMPSIALGTIYRNLGIMVKKGEIRRLVCENAPDRFDRVAPLHDHMVCTVCGSIKDVDVGLLWDTIENSVGEDIIGYDLMVRHVCNCCKGK